MGGWGSEGTDLMAKVVVEEGWRCDISTRVCRWTQNSQQWQHCWSFTDATSISPRAANLCMEQKKCIQVEKRKEYPLNPAGELFKHGEGRSGFPWQPQDGVKSRRWLTSKITIHTKTTSVRWHEQAAPCGGSSQHSVPFGNRPVQVPGQ